VSKDALLHVVRERGKYDACSCQNCKKENNAKERRIQRRRARRMLHKSLVVEVRHVEEA
jgi:hypothetical protein